MVDELQEALQRIHQLEEAAQLARIRQGQVAHNWHTERNNLMLQVATVRDDLELLKEENAGIWQAIERLMEVNEKAVNEAAQARVLLEALTGTAPDGYGAESSILSCPYCRASEDQDDFLVEHAPECPWLKARAFLAQSKQ